MGWKWDPEREAWRKDLWISGSRTKLTVRGTKKDAEAYEAQRRIELGATGHVRAKDAPAFESFCVETYKPAAKTKLRPSTWNIRRYQLAPLIEHFKLTRLTKITPAMVEAYKIARSKEVGKVTINSELNVLSAVLAYAHELKLPCATLKIKRFSVRARKGTAHAYTRDEVGWILAGAAEVGPEFFALVKFLVETGCRKSEALNLPWSRVDLKKGMARIWSATKGDEEDDGEADTYAVKSVEREVTLSDGLVKVLREQKLRVGGSEWLFPVRTENNGHTKGQRYVAWPKHTWALCLDKANTQAAKARAKAKAPPPRKIVGGPHRLRHTFASHFLQAKPDLFALGQILGHSHTRVTELYSHLLEGHMESTRNVVTFEVAATAT